VTGTISRFPLLAATFVACVLFSNSARADSITYMFTMNTSSQMNNTDVDFIDMQFSGGGLTGPGAYNTTDVATVSNFQTDGTLGGEDPYTTPFPFGGFEASGEVTGTLTNPVVFSVTGDGATNDYSQQITFGDQLSFELTISGQGVTTPICPGTSGTQCSFPGFLLDFIDTTNGTFLFSNDPSGTSPDSEWIVGGVNVNMDTTTTSYVNPGPGNSTSDLTITAVPEPRGTLVLVVAFIAMAGLMRRRRNAHRA